MDMHHDHRHHTRHRRAVWAGHRGVAGHGRVAGDFLTGGEALKEPGERVGVALIELVLAIV